MTDYEDERAAATKAVSNATVGRDPFWERADSLALAQVHATLAVAAAGWARVPRAVVFPPAPPESAGLTMPAPDAFTGSERADEPRGEARW